MRNLVPVFAACFWLSACAPADPQDDGDGELIGVWFAKDTSTGCVTELSFGLTLDDSVRVRSLCDAVGSGYRVEEAVGTFDVRGDEIVLTPELSTCPGTLPIGERFEFEVLGDQLHLTGLLGTSTLYRGNEGDDYGLDGAITYGCFEENGGFRERPLTRV